MIFSVQRSRCTDWKATRLRHGEVIPFKVNEQHRWTTWPQRLCWIHLSSSRVPSRCLPVLLQSVPRQRLPRGQVSTKGAWHQLQMTSFIFMVVFFFSSSAAAASLMPSIPCSDTKSTGCPSSIRSRETSCTSSPTKEFSSSSIFLWATYMWCLNSYFYFTCNF